MSPMLLPTRFQLDQRQIAAALVLARIRPSKRSALSDLPPPVEGASVLQGVGVLTEDGQRLTDEAEAMLRVAADPARMLSVVSNQAGRAEWMEAVLVHSAGEGPFVSVGSRDGGFDLALLPTVTQAAVLLDDLLGLTALTSQPGERPFELKLCGYAAALAAADALQSARLQARLARTAQPVPQLSAPVLERQLQEGLNSMDTRWAVTAGRRVCPADLRRVVERMEEGIAELQAAELVRQAAGGYSFTRAGYLLASALSQLVNTGGLSLTVVTGDDRLALAHASLFRTSVAIWTATWTLVTEQDADVRLFEMSSGGALGLVRGLLEPTEVPEMPEAAQPTVAAAVPSSGGPAPTAAANKCPSCGTENLGGARFCTGCGMALAQPTAPSPAPAPAFCPQCGQRVEAGRRFCTNCGHRL